MPRPKLIFLGGPPFVGKTTVARIVYNQLENCAWLDGDDVWRVNPFRLDDPRLRLSDTNMAFVLQTYLRARFDYVILSSVVLDVREIARGILARIGDAEYDLVHLTLVCDAPALAARARQRDGEHPDPRFLRQAVAAGTLKIDTTGVAPCDVAQRIVDRIREPGRVQPRSGKGA